MARLHDDIVRFKAWFRRQPKAARMALAGAGAVAGVLIFLTDAWWVLPVVVFGVVAGSELLAMKRAHLRDADRAAPRLAHRITAEVSAIAFDGTAAAQGRQAVGDAREAVTRAGGTRWDQRGPRAHGGREARADKRDQGPRPLGVHDARPIVEDGGGFWRRRGSSPRGSIVE